MGYLHESGIEEQEPDDSGYDDFVAGRKLAEAKDAAAEVAARCPTTTIFGIPFETASLRAIAPFVRFGGCKFEFTVRGGQVVFSHLTA